LGIVMASWALRPQERTIAGAPLRPATIPVGANVGVESPG